MGAQDSLGAKRGLWVDLQGLIGLSGLKKASQGLVRTNEVFHNLILPGP